MSINVSNQVALVTGASRGIGASIALTLAEAGYKVIGTATTDDGAAKISAALAAFAGCSGKNLNVNDAAAAEALIELWPLGYSGNGGVWRLGNHSFLNHLLIMQRI